MHIPYAIMCTPPEIVCNVANRTIFCRDNLDILQGIDSNCIDLIYLDPPFNKKKVFTAPIGSSAEGASFSDIFRQEDIKDEWLQTIAEDHYNIHELLNAVKNIEGNSSYNYCYLAYMAIRLIEMHRILKDSGSIYLHCDSTMSHYLKLVMDCIFGEKHFRNEVVWWYGGGGASKRYWGRKHDILLFYVKNGNWIFNVDAVREKHKWDKGQKRADGSQRDIETGKLPDDVFRMHGAMPWSKERTGYPTQKPLPLLERIITASSNAGNMVLDPFCGCATTCVAAEKLQRQWIGIDVSIEAFHMVQKRIKDEVLLTEGQAGYLPHIYFSTIPPTRTDRDTAYADKKYVYIMSHKNYPDEYKVGIAGNWKSRLTSYQTSDPDRRFKVEHTLHTEHYRAIEKHIHQHFDNKHEWVRGDLTEIINAIDRYHPQTE